ncbi:hypothetical protein HII31_09476 [Pseudocercospora fuligena]|uniref:Uncharacterized protein n=1 Tax=Pseudocercospora fuligena TaxID=685502 RepID=A0A8H6RCG3_9PEZI|nr:hypothetical protein HII31_09476 [Pseudocercospora fuligena]
MSPKDVPALTPKAELKRKHSDPTIQPLFGKKVKTVNATTLDPINIDIYRLRKEHDLEWERIAEDLNIRYNRGAATDTSLLSGGACYCRFSKYAAAIAQSRGEDYRREWYITDAHNKASLAVDNHALNKAIYLMYTKESKPWPEIARALNEKYRLDGTRGREPLTASICYKRFKNTGPSVARSLGESFEKDRYQGQQQRKTATTALTKHARPQMTATSQRKQTMADLPRTKTPKIKQKPMNGLEKSTSASRERADSDVIVVASRPAPARQTNNAVGSIKPVIASKPMAKRSVTSGILMNASSTTNTIPSRNGSKTTSGTYDASGLVKDAYAKVKARLWKDVSELVAFASKGEVTMTDEECRSVIWPK